MDQDDIGLEDIASAYPDPQKVELLASSNHLLDSAEALAAQWEARGCQYFSGVIDPNLIERARHEIQTALRELGVVADGREPLATDGVRQAGFSDASLYETTAYAALFRAPSTIAFLARIFGEPVHITGQTQIRYAIPGDHLHDQPPHQDGPYLRVTGARTIWVPLMPIDRTIGGLAVLAGSHHSGEIQHVPSERASVVVPGRRLQRVPPDRMRGRWMSADYRPGDCMVFHANCIHAALPNGSSLVRLSVDGRAQPARIPMTLKQQLTRPDMERYRRCVAVLAREEGIPFAEADLIAEEMLHRSLPLSKDNVVETHTDVKLTRIRNERGQKP